MVPGLTLTSPGKLLDMQSLGPHPRPTGSDTCDLLFNKPCTLKFENYCCSLSAAIQPLYEEFGLLLIGFIEP